VKTQNALKIMTSTVRNYFSSLGVLSERMP